MRPVGRTEQPKINMLRKQIFAGLVSMMNQIVVTEPDLIVGCGQGAIIALPAGLPLVLEKGVPHAGHHAGHDEGLPPGLG